MISKRSPRGIHRVGNLIKLISEEMRVQIEGHRRRLVAQH
jgi:hypothetical protein